MDYSIIFVDLNDELFVKSIDDIIINSKRHKDKKCIIKFR